MQVEVKLYYFFKTLNDRWLPSLDRWIRKNASVSIVTFVLGVLSGLFALYKATFDRNLASLQIQLQNAQANLSQERVETQEKISNQERLIHELWPGGEHGTPVLISPENGSSLVDDEATLAWRIDPQKQRANPNYLVEVLKIDELGSEASLEAEPIVATNPNFMETRYPIELESKLEVGTYLWRVAIGDKKDNRLSLEGNWSGYYLFKLYSNSIDRIIETGKLRVGVNYFQASVFIRRDKHGNPSGLDFKLIRHLARQIPKHLRINGIPCAMESLKVEIVEFPTVDEVLFDGLSNGKIDVAIGSITRAKYREERNIAFSGDYLKSHLVLLANYGSSAKFVEFVNGRGDNVGVVKGTTNERAAQEITLKLTTSKKPWVARTLDSYQELIKSIENGNLSFIIIDEPIAHSLVASKKLKLLTDTGLRTYLDNYYEKVIGHNEETYAIATRLEDTTLTRLIREITNTTEWSNLVGSLRDTFKFDSHFQVNPSDVAAR